MDLFTHIKTRLEAQFGPRYKQDRFVLAVSGGIDSMVLAECFAKILPASQLLIAHFDHQIREAASKDAAFVESFALKNSIQFAKAVRRIPHVDEARLRKERFEFLESQRISFCANAIVLAHHLDDQLETLFIRLARGTGVKGLAGMREWRAPRFRPLLSVSRRVIEAFALQQSIKFVEDESNAQSIYFRNRVRGTLIPTFRKLTQEFGSEAAFENRFNGLMGEFQRVQSHLETLGMALLDRCATISPYWIRISQKEFTQLKSFEQNLLLRHVIDQLGVETLDRNRFERLSNEVLNPQLKQLDQKGSLSVLHSFGQLYFRTDTQRKMDPPQFKVVDQLARNPVLGFSGSVETGICWRTFQPGDRWETKKLKACFQRWRVPRPERSLVPLLVEKKGGRVRWLPYAKEPSKHLKTLTFPFTRPIAQ